VFLDYNQNAKDRTVASVYSVRPTADARVSAPMTWDEVPTCELGDFTLKTMPARFAAIGDPWATMDDHPGALDGLLALHESQGQGDAPWPPHYAKAEGEPQLWVSKDRFLPTRLRFNEGTTAWDVRFSDYTSQATGEVWPRVLEISKGNEPQLRVMVLSADNKADLSQVKF